MKASNKVQIFLFMAILVFFVAWKFHFLPKNIYSSLPITTDSFKKVCHFKREAGACAVFQCGGSFYAAKLYEIKVGLAPNMAYLLEAEVIFRNRREVCPGKDGQKDYLFSINKIMLAPQ